MVTNTQEPTRPRVGPIPTGDNPTMYVRLEGDIHYRLDSPPKVGMTFLGLDKVFVFCDHLKHGHQHRVFQRDCRSIAEKYGVSPAYTDAEAQANLGTSACCESCFFYRV